MNTLTALPRPTAKIQPLSRQLPHTFKDVEKGMNAALEEYFRLQKVYTTMQNTSEPLFEKVRKKGLSDPHLFLNLEGDISVAVSPKDINTPHKTYFITK